MLDKFYKIRRKKKEAQNEPKKEAAQWPRMTLQMTMSP
jgi:hypothetical protein